MKKLITLAIGILLNGVLLSQIPFKVLKVVDIEDGDTTEVQMGVTNIELKTKMNAGILSFEAREPELNLKVKLDKFNMKSTYYKSHSTWDKEEHFIHKRLGNVEIRHDWLHGYIKIDSNKDGLFDRIIYLCPNYEKDYETYLY